MDHDLQPRDLDPDPAAGRNGVVVPAVFLSAGLILIFQGIYTPRFLGRIGIGLPPAILTAFGASIVVGTLLLLSGLSSLVRVLFRLR